HPPRIDRQRGHHLERLEIRGRRDGRHDRDQADRDGAAIEPHHAAVTHGGAEDGLAVVPFIDEGHVSHVVHGRCHAQCASPPKNAARRESPPRASYPHPPPAQTTPHFSPVRLP